ncbi:prepilin-type N-terminal cleavage/methylation domain-containing protein [bacterium]|nr:prepilin-type N-terminal cleavage/methylation domain-containing protein [bacterium]
MQRTNGRRRRRGFSLIEMLIGMVLLAIGLGAMAALSISVSNLMSRNQNLSAACNLAEQKLEELRNANYADIVSDSDGAPIDSAGGDTGDTIYTRSWTVTDDEPATNMKSVAVTVSWSQWGQTRIYELRGVIAND